MLTLEYSSDAYETEEDRLGFEQDSPINLAATYRFHNGLDLTGAWLYGNTFGLAMSYTFNPRQPARRRSRPGRAAGDPRAPAPPTWAGHCPPIPPPACRRRPRPGSPSGWPPRASPWSPCKRQGSTLRLHSAQRPLLCRGPGPGPRGPRPDRRAAPPEGGNPGADPDAGRRGPVGRDPANARTWKSSRVTWTAPGKATRAATSRMPGPTAPTCPASRRRG